MAVVWPWQIEILDDRVCDINIPLTLEEPGTYYVQIMISTDPSSVPYDAEPTGGLPLPGESFCGGALMLMTSERTIHG